MRLIPVRAALAAACAVTLSLPAADPEARRKPARLLTDGVVKFEEVKISPDAKLVVARGNDERVRVWSLETGKLLHRLDERPRSMSGPSLWFTRDGRHLLVHSSRHNEDNSKVVEQRLCWWDPKTGKAGRVLAGKDMPGGILAMGPDGKVMATGSLEGEVRGVYLRDPRTAKVLRRIDPPDGADLCAFTPDGRRLFTLSYANEIRVWDVATGKSEPWAPVPPLRGISSLVFTPGGDHLVLATSELKYPVALADVRTGGATPAAKVSPRNHRCLALARDGSWLLMAGGHHPSLYDPRNGRQLHTQYLGVWEVDSLAVSADDKWLVTVAPGDECLKVWKLADW